MMLSHFDDNFAHRVACSDTCEASRYVAQREDRVQAWSHELAGVEELRQLLQQVRAAKVGVRVDEEGLRDVGRQGKRGEGSRDRHVRTPSTQLPDRALSRPRLTHRVVHDIDRLVRQHRLVPPVEAVVVDQHLRPERAAVVEVGGGGGRDQPCGAIRLRQLQAHRARPPRAAEHEHRAVRAPPPPRRRRARVPAQRLEARQPHLGHCAAFPQAEKPRQPAELRLQRD
eukprot:CAMPEP_0184394400 /NCGR_PEP_ID=MMETSP0007-20130409/39739_1 /TAXON_ID=97485 /ORGANISM="Prymnesium parvum, Strain Texoma1" /LENGTH=226 /DNA_ID=CAMNT_0026745947 /DNA_START=265 /DNA_END=942 /DNA_ORIENTATION=+